jgi:hypothetical protein
VHSRLALRLALLLLLLLGVGTSCSSGARDSRLARRRGRSGRLGRHQLRTAHTALGSSLHSETQSAFSNQAGESCSNLGLPFRFGGLERSAILGCLLCVELPGRHTSNRHESQLVTQRSKLKSTGNQLRKQNYRCLVDGESGLVLGVLRGTQLPVPLGLRQRGARLSLGNSRRSSGS